MEDLGREQLLELLREKDAEITRLQALVLDLTMRLNGSSERITGTPTNSSPSSHHELFPRSQLPVRAAEMARTSEIPRPVFRRTSSAVSSTAASNESTPPPSAQARPFVRQATLGRTASEGRGSGPVSAKASPMSLTRRRKSGDLLSASAVAAMGSVGGAAAEEPEQACVLLADAGFATRLNVKGRTMTVFAPRDHVPADEDGATPGEKLELQRVLGYRCKNVRANLHSLVSDETLFSLGRVCALQHSDGTQRLYTEHSGEVQCMAVHFSAPIVASGQKAWMSLPGDQAHVRVWNYEDLKTVRVLGLGIIQHSVACVAFSPSDESILVSVDDSVHHTIVLWSWRDGNALTQATGHVDTICAAAFNHVTHFLVTCGKQHISFWNIAASPENPTHLQLTKKMGLFQANPKPKVVSCMCFAPSGDTVAGDSNGNIFAWGPPLPSFLVTNSIKGAHKGGVSAVVATPYGFLSAGSSDHCVRIWAWNYHPFQVLNDELNMVVVGRPIRTLAATMTENGPSLSQFLVGCTDNSIAAVDASDGSVVPFVRGPADPVEGMARLPGLLITACISAVNAWALPSFNYAWQWTASGEGESTEISCIDACPTTGHVVVGLPTGVVLLSREGLFSGLFEEAHAVIALKLAPSGRLLAVALTDGQLYVRGVAEEPSELPIVCECKGLQARLASLDWSQDETALMATSISYELVCFNATTGAIIPSADARSLSWASYSSSIGWASCGVMSMNAPAGCCERSPDQRTLAVGDALGDMRLFRWPSYKIGASSRAHRGHSSAITAVRFLDEDFLASVSAQDNMLCVWQYHTVHGRGGGGGGGGAATPDAGSVIDNSAFGDDARSVDLESPDFI